ncbi:MAG: hypothetical protein COA90_11720 [Gammaproteobacteria bacterium]|nr:MAG: hypothetical protein COA90_11720 [Gammaproteobacteria bacterium]
MKKLQLISSIALTLSTFALAGQAQAITVVGGSSNTSNITVGVSNFNMPPHTAGRTGIAFPVFSGLLVDFQGLANYTTPVNGVYSLDFPYSGAPASHDDLGVFNFAQVGTSDIWFGEWSDTGSPLAATRTVYFAGDNPDSSISTTGTNVTYTMKGINNYYDGYNGALSGTFTADFNNSTLTGSMSSALSSVDIGTVTINSDASITGTGTASATVLFFSASGGDVSGQFYNGQADLAGMVDFAGTIFDTSFGGTQD